MKMQKKTQSLLEILRYVKYHNLYTTIMENKIISEGRYKSDPCLLGSSIVTKQILTNDYDNNMKMKAKRI